MIVQGLNNASATYAALQTSPLMRQASPSPAANHAEKVSISDAAKTMLAGDQEVAKRLAEIKSRPAVERTAADRDYLVAHDQRMVDIEEKLKTSGWESLSADEVDYMQKAGGFVNTMAELSSQEKALYDEMVAAGNREAAEGLMLVALSRSGMHGQQVTLPNGRSFDPSSTEITGDNVRNLFKYLFADDDGQIGRQFEALASYLDQRQPPDQATTQA